MFKSYSLVALALVITLFYGFDTAQAKSNKVLVKIDISSQHLKLYKNGRFVVSWPISTARKGYRTPIGTFKPTRTHRKYFSRKYDNAPMPHSIFFYGGYAIHGTDAIKRLGSPASHGCIRLHPKNARTLFNMVTKVGKKRTKIVIQH